MAGYVLYGGEGTGAVAVELALTLMGLRYELKDVPDAAALEAAAEVNPMRQVPTLVFPDRTLMTESAAILIRLTELHPEAGLAPTVGDPHRPPFLRWMSFVSSAIYAHYWVKDNPLRIVSDPAQAPVIEGRLNDRIVACWAMMEAATDAGPYILGDQLTVLDLYVAVVSRFRPRRQRFYAAAPRMAEAVRRVDADPRLARVWAERYPKFEGWDRI